MMGFLFENYHWLALWTLMSLAITPLIGGLMCVGRGGCDD